MPMPVGDYVKISVGGSIATEQWSINVWAKYSGGVQPTPAQLNAWALQVLNGFKLHVWSAVTGPLAVFNSTGCNVASAKAYFYRNGSLLVAGTAGITPVAGNASSTIQPAYVSLVCTLLTLFPGRSKRGRVYLPATGVGLTAATFQVTSVVSQDGLAVNMWNWFVTANDFAPGWDVPGSVVVGVMSLKTSTFTPLSGVRIDSLPDTQHGRSRRLVSAHISSAP
jgi:hypothetical protein